LDQFGIDSSIIPWKKTEASVDNANNVLTSDLYVW